MRILMVNDDGIQSPGILKLAQGLKQRHEITIVAPEAQRSAYSHSFTLFQDIAVRRVRVKGLEEVPCFQISGTPADCTKLGVLSLMEQPPDLVVSGINQGANLGTDIAYSGTLGAAFEAGLLGYPAIAFSQYMRGGKEADFETAVEIAAQWIDTFPIASIPIGTVLNINIPAVPKEEIRGVKMTSQGTLDYRTTYARTMQAEDEFSCRIQGELQPSKEEGTDVWAIQQGYISVSPLQCDRTDWAMLEELQKMQF